ncbi:MAG: class I SAM-dependent methyltransferase family protein [Methanomassiliicoccales archaeon]
MNRHCMPVREGSSFLIPVTEFPPWTGSGERCLFDFPPRREEGGYRRRVRLPAELSALLPSSFDIIGSKALIRLPAELRPYEGEIGEAIMEVHRSVDGVFEEMAVGGAFRTRKIRHIAGAETTETTVRESGLIFKTDIAKTFFSPRLAAERNRVLMSAGISERVLDMFAGVGPFSIALASKASSVLAADINPYAVSYAKENVKLNRRGNVRVVLRDAREIEDCEFDRIIMNLPLWGISFLEHAMKLLATNGSIHYYELVEERRLNEWKKAFERRGLTPFNLRKVKSYSPQSSIYHAELRTSV